MGSDHIEVITDIERSLVVCKALQNEEVVSLDCEGVNLGTKGYITLIQIGTVEGKAYLFDIKVKKALINSGGLRELLQFPKVIKAIHACPSDAATLYLKHSVRVEPMFDVQVADRLLEVAKGNINAKVTNLNSLVTKYGGKSNQDKDLQLKIPKKPALWAKRPLTQKMISYAAADVTCLIPEVFSKISELINDKDLGNEWMLLTREAAGIMYYNKKPKSMWPDIKLRYSLQKLQGLNKRQFEGASISELLTEQERICILQCKDTRQLKQDLYKTVVTARQKMMEEFVNFIEAKIDAGIVDEVVKDKMLQINMLMDQDCDKDLRIKAIGLKRRVTEIQNNEIVLKVLEGNLDLTFEERRKLMDKRFSSDGNVQKAILMYVGYFEECLCEKIKNIPRNILHMVSEKDKGFLYNLDYTLLRKSEILQAREILFEDRLEKYQHKRFKPY